MDHMGKSNVCKSEFRLLVQTVHAYQEILINAGGAEYVKEHGILTVVAKLVCTIGYQSCSHP